MIGLQPVRRMMTPSLYREFSIDHRQHMRKQVIRFNPACIEGQTASDEGYAVSIRPDGIEKHLRFGTREHQSNSVALFVRTCEP